LKCPGDGFGDMHRLRNRKLLLAQEQRAERLPFYEWHDIVQQPVGFTAVEQRQQVRVLEMCRDLDLGEEALDAEHRTELWIEQLQGHGAVMADVVREKHGRHAAPADLLFYLVAVGDRDLELLDDLQ